MGEEKKIALHHIHEKRGAKMIPFAGYLMPVHYKGVNIEHQSVRNNVGVFDISHMGEFIIKGKGAFDLVQKLTSNDVNLLYKGKVQYAYMPNTTGGIIDDLLVYCLDKETYLLVVNASNIDKDLNWIIKNKRSETEIIDISEKTTLLAIQGPNAEKVLSPLTSLDLSEMPYYSFLKGEFAGVENVLISKTGYTGAGGFEIYIDNKNAEIVWNGIMITGKEFDIEPVGLAARDTLRLEMGFCLYGNEISEKTSPFEAGLGWITKFNNSFINSENLLIEKEKNLPKKKLVGFELLEKGIPRKDYIIKNNNHEEIGIVTSGTMSPYLKKSIGMGYINIIALVKNEIFIEIRGKLIEAKVVKLPFINNII